MKQIWTEFVYIYKGTLRDKERLKSGQLKYKHYKQEGEIRPKLGYPFVIYWSFFNTPVLRMQQQREPNAFSSENSSEIKMFLPLSVKGLKLSWLRLYIHVPNCYESTTAWGGLIWAVGRGCEWRMSSHEVKCPVISELMNPPHPITHTHRSRDHRG